MLVICRAYTNGRYQNKLSTDIGGGGGLIDWSWPCIFKHALQDKKSALYNSSYNDSVVTNGTVCMVDIGSADKISYL